MSAHDTHCCTLHGCKYGDADCPIENGPKRDPLDTQHCEWCYYLVRSAEFRLSWELALKSSIFLNPDGSDMTLRGELELQDGTKLTAHGYTFNTTYNAMRDLLLEHFHAED